MRIQNLLLASSLVVLYGCQPETPAQPPVTPAAVPAEPVEAQAITAPVVEASPAPAVPEPSVAEKTAPAAQGTPEAVKGAPVAKPAAPARETAVAVVKAEPAPAVPEIKPEVKTPEVKTEAAPPEADAMQLAKKYNCFACHVIDKKMVGPAWKDVADKYRGDAGAEERLMEKIAKGGKGVWGAMAMPANPKIGQADLRTLSRFVLSLE